MGVFKNIKKRYIAIISVCVVIVVSCGVYIGITLWPKEEKAPEPTKSEQSSERQEQSDGPLYEVVSCEELAQITGEPCNNNTETYTPPTYTPSYTAPDSTQTQAPTQYNAPSVDPMPSNTPTCADLHTKYYATYQSKASQIRRQYNAAIEDASMSCHSFGGCPAASNLENQMNAELSQAKSNYKQSMESYGCDPNQYVDF